MPSFSLVGALEFRQVVASLQHQAAGSSLNMFESPITPYAGRYYHTHSRPNTRTPSREVDPWDAALGVPLDERSRPHLLVTPALTDEPEIIPEGASEYLDDASRSRGTSVPSISRTPASPTVSDGDTESQIYSPLSHRQRVLYILGRTYHTLFPTLHHFRSKSVLGQIASVFAAPAVMLLTLTLPVVVTPYGSIHVSPEKTSGDGRLIDFEEEGIERALIAEEEVQENMHVMTFNKWLMAAQCTFGPLFCVGVLFSTCVDLSNITNVHTHVSALDSF
jgi:sodium/potassium/calcium exchanger 6